MQVEYSGEVGAGDAADGAHWHPVFGEVDALPRLQERIGFLVAHQPRLHLDVGAVVVGEGAPPVETVGIHAPRPDLLGGQIGVVGIVGDAGLRLGMVDAHERFTAAVYELGNRTARLVAYHAQVDSGRVDRPGFHLGETVAGGPAHGIPDFRVVPHAHSGVVPPVESMPHVAAVVEGDALFQYGGAGRQAQLDRPLHAVRAVDVAHHHARAAVRVFRKGEIHRRHGDPIVRDREIELDAECRPRAAIADLRLLDGRVGVEHRLSADFVDASVEVAADVGQYRALEVLVFQVDGAPGGVHSGVGNVLAQRIGVAEFCRGELVEGRIRVGTPFLISGESEHILPHADIGG